MPLPPIETGLVTVCREDNNIVIIIIYSYLLGFFFYNDKKIFFQLDTVFCCGAD